MSFCHSCGCEIKPDWNNCVKCGSVVDGAASPDPASYSDLELMQSGWTVNQIYDLRHSSTNVQTFNPEKVPQSSYHDNTTNTCSNCGKGLFQGWRKCSHCGHEQELQISNRRDWDNPERSDIDGPFYNARKYHQYLASTRTFSTRMLDIISLIGTWSVVLLIPIVILGFIFNSETIMVFALLLCVFYIYDIQKIFIPLFWFFGKTIDPPLHRFEKNRGYDGKKIYHCTYCDFSVKQSFWNNPEKLMKKHWKNDAHFEDYYSAIILGVIDESRHQFIIRMSGKFKWIAFLTDLILAVLIIIFFASV